MKVPYGALPGFSLSAEIRYIAAYYDVPTSALRRWRRHHNARVVEARQALYWRLTRERSLPPTVAGRLLGVADAKHVRQGAAKHAARIREFCATSGAVRGGPP